MLEADAMRLAAERSCEMRGDESERCGLILPIAYDGDLVCLPAATRACIGAQEFLRDWIPERP